MEHSRTLKTRTWRRSLLLCSIVVALGTPSAARAAEPETELYVASSRFDGGFLEARALAVQLDQEHSADGRPLTPATLSINRYHSRLRELDRVDATADPSSRRLSFRLYRDRVEGAAVGEPEVRLKNIDARFLVPVLPYASAAELDEFDRFNLMLAEYARTGVHLGYHTENDRFGYFDASAGLLEARPEYHLNADGPAPNPALRPRRLALVNNCLDAGRWELSATDSAGEMFHAWLTLPSEFYAGLVRLVNGFEVGTEAVLDALTYEPGPGPPATRIERLREPTGRRWKLTGIGADNRPGGYSTQDSRRKVQRGYFWVERDGRRIEADRLSSLEGGDELKLLSFVLPGVYSDEPETISYRDDWTTVEIAEVVPLTHYEGNANAYGELGHLEITVETEDGTRAVVVGNVPVELLVPQADYLVPAFGAGVLSSSELVERRYFRLTEGPAPHYAYLVGRDDGRSVLLNNHEHGFEQVVLRTVERDGRVFLRLTLVAYERIVDLVEVEVELPRELAYRIQRAAERYQPPVYRVYADTNIL